MANNQKKHFNAKFSLDICTLPQQTKLARIMPAFPNSLISVGSLCNADIN